MAGNSFEQWVRGIFDHPVTEPAWYWANDADTCEEDDPTNVSYLTRLFNESGLLLQPFTNAQVGQGLWMIASNGCSNHAFSIVSGSAAWRVRRLAIRSIYQLNAQCFAKRCEEGLGHLDEAMNPLNAICYMWWDVFPAWWNSDSDTNREEAMEYLNVMSQCLSLRHVACIEGALHGLGHWRHGCPELVEPIIDRFLADSKDLRPELLHYARCARAGMVQ